MPEFLLTGLSPEGKKETVRLDAPTADLAVKMLHKRGYDEIVLHTDDVGAIYSHQGDVAETISPEEYLSFRSFGGALDSFLFTFRKMYQGQWYLHLAAIAVLAVRRGWDWPWDTLDYVAIAWLAFPLAWAIVSHFLFRGPQQYGAVLESISWGRGEEALKRLEKVRGKIPPEEAAFIEAQALARLGQFDAAMKVVKPYSDGEQMPAWLYWGRIGDVYFAAGKQEMIVPAQEKAAEMAPDNPTVLLDLAMSLVRYRRDAVRSRQLLQEARTHALSDVLAIFAGMIEGMIEVEAGNAPRARTLLEEAVEKLQPFANATPLVAATIDRTCAYLALASAELRDTDAAKKYYARAEPRLRAVGSHDLVARCEAALHLKPARV